MEEVTFTNVNDVFKGAFFSLFVDQVDWSSIILDDFQNPNESFACFESCFSFKRTKRNIQIYLKHPG